MGRPEPCVLYAHTFVHPHLDEYVDEVLFSEPVVITACELLEQNAPSLCPAVKLMGATSPPSFALEVFVHCEGETRFRRLCLPFLYSHSSSNVLELEAVVTNHLVVRGSYRSLSMVIYGNTAEDLGQFNIEVDLDSSLTETVSAVEGNLEDLPPAFRPTNFLVEELISPLKILSHLAVPSDVPLELRQFLQLVFKILDCHDQASADEVLSSLLSVASTYATPCWSYKTPGPRHHGNDKLMNDGDAHHILTEGKKLSDIYGRLLNQPVNPSPESSAESIFLESETGVPTSKDLVDTLHQRLDLCSSAGNVGYSHLSQNKNTILWLSLASLLCSARESCFHFVNYGGLKQLQHTFTHQNSGSTAL
ncbi:hypothetical protein CDL12_09500 [Handroanthus impetiginosus]|uniref:Virilizer N-terminal domain-containing protein n=1 Tax=Handroanthus impetiginosus TaxID=429701 RepID=A0A2G9HKM2_9LAMI|nr:hypothetical protein CDL12_09500 [Handroanthus impetiginosus]